MTIEELKALGRCALENPPRRGEMITIPEAKYAGALWSLAPEILALVEAANKWEQVGDGCHWEELDLLKAVRAFNAKLVAL